MSVFKRAEWHSGLTYRQTCRECNTVVEYTDHKLGFRPWFADGFVYCPKCETPLRHNEDYAIDGLKKQEILEVELKETEEIPAVESEPVAKQAPVVEEEEAAAVTSVPIRPVIEDEDRTVVLTEIPIRPVAVEEAAAEAVVEQEALSAFCHQCGKKFLEDDRFCSGCGTKRR